MNLISYSGKTSKGPYFNLNEDAFYTNSEMNLYYVLDGFGGVGVGEKAIQRLEERFPILYSKISGDPDATLPFYYNPNLLLEGNALMNAILESHNDLISSNSNKAMGERAGISGSFIAVSRKIITLMSIGNIQSYLLSKGSLEKIVEEDTMKFYSSRTDRRESMTVPRNALGLYQKLDLSIKEVRVEKGDMIILLTDGVYSKISNDEILDLFSTSDNYLKTIENVFSLANERKNIDNQTCLVLQF